MGLSRLWAVSGGLFLVCLALGLPVRDGVPDRREGAGTRAVPSESAVNYH